MAHPDGRGTSVWYIYLRQSELEINYSQ
jgi:hypothetical protein